MNCPLQTYSSRTAEQRSTLKFCRRQGLWSDEDFSSGQRTFPHSTVGKTACGQKANTSVGLT